MDNEQFETFLNRALKRRAEPLEVDEAATERILKRLSGPLPRQKISFWQLPEVLLDWQFAPAWPRMAALACCAILGFMIGIAGLDRSTDLRGSPFVISNSGDLGSVVFEPEPLTGARP
jgi:hypothetical protein